MHRQITHTKWSGPIPPPDVLRELEEILPGSTGRIFILAEKQADHRFKLEESVVTSRSANMKRGQIIAAIVTLCMIGAATFLAINGCERTAMVLAGINFASLTWSYCWGQYTQKKERAEKRQPPTSPSPPTSPE